jgi:hypothetical protein
MSFRESPRDLRTTKLVSTPISFSITCWDPAYDCDESSEHLPECRVYHSVFDDEATRESFFLYRGPTRASNSLLKSA